ncbi:MAG TPA: hypothetical protein VK498_00585 [Ferruginibacter sp.]|nr:hypothetical protein [Ferruginibacter sp.]
MTQPDNNLLTREIFLIGDEEQLKNKILFDKLSAQINDLIINDFERLISLLYRIDVSEKKLKEILKEKTSTDSADLIAGLIIERQIQKIKSRKEFKGNDKEEL